MDTISRVLDRLVLRAFWAAVLVALLFLIARSRLPGNVSSDNVSWKQGISVIDYSIARIALATADFEYADYGIVKFAHSRRYGFVFAADPISGKWCSVERPDQEIVHSPAE